MRLDVQDSVLTGLAVDTSCWLELNWACQLDHLHMNFPCSFGFLQHGDWLGSKLEHLQSKHQENKFKAAGNFLWSPSMLPFYFITQVNH